MRSKVLLSGLFVCALSACAVRQPIPPYIGPVSGAVAKIQVRSNQFAGYGFLYSFDDQRACKGNRMISSTNGGMDQFKVTTSLRGDEPASLWFSYLAPGNRTCNSVRTFKPVSGKNYLVVISATDAGCSLSIQDITDPTYPKFEASYFQRTYLPTLIRENSHCAGVDVDAQIIKARKPNLSGLKMDDLKALLPAVEVKEK